MQLKKTLPSAVLPFEMIYYCQLPINKILIVYIGSISVRYMNLYISFFSVLSLVHCVEFLQRDKCSLIYSKYILTNSLRHLIVSKPNMAQETEKTAEKFLTLHPKVIIRQTFGMFIQETYVRNFIQECFSCCSMLIFLFFVLRAEIFHSI